MKLTGHRLSAALPDGWEGAIVRQAPVEGAGAQFHALGDDPPAATTIASLPVVHLANFPLPAGRGDFGSGAVEVMRDDDVFVSLLEYGPENVGTPLFDAPLPRRLAATDFDPMALQRTLPGQAGHQRFFTAAGRAFCLYVVVADWRRLAAALPRIDGVLAGLEISP